MRRRSIFQLMSWKILLKLSRKIRVVYEVRRLSQRTIVLVDLQKRKHVFEVCVARVVWLCGKKETVLAVHVIGTDYPHMCNTHNNKKNICLLAIRSHCPKNQRHKRSWPLLHARRRYEGELMS